MRLQTKHKAVKPKQENKKKYTKKKKETGPKINALYFSNSPYKQGHGTINLTKLTYGIIDSCNLESVSMMDGTMTLTNSWIELLLIMLDALIENKPKEFNELLAENKVTNQWFCVDKYYGKYSFEVENPKVYNIYNSGYYLEAIFNNENIFSAIIGLSKCLGYQLTDMELNIKNKNYVDIDLNFDLLSEEESVVDINHITPMLKQGIHLVSMSILGVNSKVHRMDVALLIFCNWVYDSYGMITTMSLPTCGETGICMEDDMEDKICEPIRGSKVSVYTDGNNDDIVKFIKKSMEQLKIDKSQVIFKFRALKSKETLKEWEVE